MKLQTSEIRYKIYCFVRLVPCYLLSVLRKVDLKTDVKCA